MAVVAESKTRIIEILELASFLNSFRVSVYRFIIAALWTSGTCMHLQVWAQPV
jgi:hypothetical protein